MKTRQEMIYDFMIALASNPAYFAEMIKELDVQNKGQIVALYTLHQAENMADMYLKEIAS